MQQADYFEYLPDDWSRGDWKQLKTAYLRLLRSPVCSNRDLQRWVRRRSALDAAATELFARRKIAYSTDMTDEDAGREWTEFQQQISPRLNALRLRLDGRFLEIWQHHDSADPRLQRYEQQIRARRKIYVEENADLQRQEAEVKAAYDEITRGWVVDFDGKHRSVSDMSQYFLRPERELRAAAWRVIHECYKQDAERIEELMSEIVRIRCDMAQNTEFGSLADLVYASVGRLDFEPNQTRALHEAAEYVLVPSLEELDDTRRQRLSLDRLRPWDYRVDPAARRLPSPFADVSDLIGRATRMFERMGGGLGDLFDHVARPDNRDLAWRSTKLPGGYQVGRPLTGTPFLYLNVTGQPDDLRRFIHETGHVFHTLLASEQPLYEHQQPTLDFAEFAAMGLELLTLPHWDEFYPDNADLEVAKRNELRGMLNAIVRLGAIDAFESEMYENRIVDQRERRELWRSCHARFLARDLDWSGLQDDIDILWHPVTHLFSLPFYVISYCVAGSGALQLYAKAKEEGVTSAIDAYLNALSLGSSEPLPRLFEAAGLEFEFGPALFARLLPHLEDEL